jgi:hypothetical protein
VNLSEMKFPRQLEIEYGADTIRRVIATHTKRLWSGGDFDVPFVAFSDLLKNSLQEAVHKGYVRFGLESVSVKLQAEQKGISHITTRGVVPHGGRISRLILLSNDGAERLYRHVEQLLRSHTPRLLVCLLDADSAALGKLITGKEKQIKLVMAEHKDAVSEILRAVLGEQIQS